MIDLKIKRLSSSAVLPTRGTSESAGLDLYADLGDADQITIMPGETIKVHTGVAIELPPNTFGGIVARSGLATKQGLAPANKLGVVDSDYRGEVIVALYNQSSDAQIIHSKSRIAQLIVMPYVPVSVVEVDNLSDTNRGEGGFGSTGLN